MAPTWASPGLFLSWVELNGTLIIRNRSNYTFSCERVFPPDYFPNDQCFIILKDFNAK